MTPSTGRPCGTGTSSSRAGRVHGRRPLGSIAPESTAASDRPASCPGSHHQSTAGTSSSHGSSTGAPAFTTTTVRGFAAADPAHELVLASRQGEVRAIPALGLGLGVGADDHDGEVGCRGRRDGAVELLVDREAGRAVPEVQSDEPPVGLAVDHLDLGVDPHAARGDDLDDGLDAARVAVAGVEDDLDADLAVGCRAQFAVDRDAVGADGSELDHVGAGPLEGDVGEHAHGGHGVVVHREPEARGIRKLHGLEHGAIGVEELDADAGLPVGRREDPAGGERRADGRGAAAVQRDLGLGEGRAERLERVAHVRRRDERAAAALGEGLDRVVADEGDATRAVGAGRDGQQCRRRCGARPSSGPPPR